MTTTSLLVLGVVTIFLLLRSAALVYGLSSNRKPLIVRAYRKIFHYGALSSYETIEGHHGPLRMRLYAPQNRNDAPTIVLVHGLSATGMDNTIMDFLGNGLAEGGFRVVIPDILTEKDHLMRVAALEDIGDAAHWSAVRGGYPVSLFGISFGGGLVLATAALPQYAPDIKLVFSTSGYNSIERLGEYYLGNEALDPEGKPYPGPPQQSGPLLMAYQHLEQMVPPADLEALRPAILQDITYNPDPLEVKAAFARLTPRQTEMFNALKSANLPEVRRAYAELLSRNREELEAISPHGRLGGLHCPVYELHGLHDNAIPQGESEWTAHELQGSGETHLLVTGAIRHAYLNQDATSMERVELGIFVARVLHAAAGN